MTVPYIVPTLAVAAAAAADKNQHRLEEAHAVFQEVQNAYEVLSDKHERAW